ncbi:hypothetical protein [Polaribacter atrinae]
MVRIDKHGIFIYQTDHFIDGIIFLQSALSVHLFINYVQYQF